MTNFILFNPEETRAESIGCYGHPHPPYSAPSEWHDLIDLNDLPPLRPADLPGKPDFFEHIANHEIKD